VKLPCFARVKKYGPDFILMLETEGRRRPPPISRRQWPDTGRPTLCACSVDIMVDCCGGEMPKEFVRVVEFPRQAHMFCDFNQKFALA